MHSPRRLLAIALFLACGTQADTRGNRDGDKPTASDGKPVEHERQTLAGAKMQVPQG
jgi:hypothetical protein